MSDKKEQLFTRNHPDAGVWAFLHQKDAKDKGIKYTLTDREILATSDEKLIKILKADPEIKEFIADKDTEAPKPYASMNIEELKKAADEKTPPIDHTKLENAGELIDALNAHDKSNSTSENDPGEQN